MRTNSLKKLRLIFCLFFALIIGCLSGLATGSDDFCWKDSYGRGVGTIPTACAEGMENQAGLCYKSCPSGMYGVGPVCWSSCPSGYTDVGAICHISLPLTVEGSWNCTNKKFGVCWARSHDCPSGYTNVGLFCALSARPTPAGFSGTYLDPMKNSQGRGAGTIPKSCTDGKTYDAGLCYQSCRGGYYGVGPVCWVNAPQGWVGCGMGAASSSSKCGEIMSNQIFSVGAIALNIVSAGAASKAEEAATAAEKEEVASQLAKKAEATAQMVNRLKTLSATLNVVINCMPAISQIVNDASNKSNAIAIDSIAGGVQCIAALADLGGTTPNKKTYTKEEITAAQVFIKDFQARLVLAQQQFNLSQSSNVSAADQVQAAASVASTLDPTGIANAVAAYSYPKCSALTK